MVRVQRPQLENLMHLSCLPPCTPSTEITVQATMNILETQPKHTPAVLMRSTTRVIQRDNNNFRKRNIYESLSHYLPDYCQRRSTCAIILKSVFLVLDYNWVFFHWYIEKKLDFMCDVITKAQHFEHVFKNANTNDLLIDTGSLNCSANDVAFSSGNDNSQRHAKLLWGRV